MPTMASYQAGFLLSVAALLFSLPSFPSTVHAATASNLGVNYGQIANNLPPPSSVIPLLRALNVTRVKLYDANPGILKAFAGSDIDFVIAVPDEIVSSLARDPAAAPKWVKSSLTPFAGSVSVSAVTVGNEVFTKVDLNNISTTTATNDTAKLQSLLPAMQALKSALASAGLANISVTTPHSLAVLTSSYPPSAGAFDPKIAPYITKLLSFLNATGAPFLINAYPYFAYKNDPHGIPLDYVLFRPNKGVVDPKTGLTYTNMLHAQVDAVRAAIGRLAGSQIAQSMDIRVSETGWPSKGGSDEAGATAENALAYNGNLMRLLAEGKGTPMRPHMPLEVYVFALFNENLKPGPTSERNYGLFKPDGTLAYPLNISLAAPVSGVVAAPVGAAVKSTAAAPSPSSSVAPNPTSTGSKVGVGIDASSRPLLLLLLQVAALHLLIPSAWYY